MRTIFPFSAVFLIIMMMTSCVSIEDAVMRKAGELLSSDSSGSVFTSDEDPALIADALPLTMKLYEMVLESQPENPELNFATGKNFILYANAFIQTPAEMLPDEDWLENEAMIKRAKKMYLRGRNYILKSFDLSHPGLEDLLSAGELDKAFLLCGPEDVPKLYWAASAWIGAFGCDPFDFALGTEIYIPTAMLFRALELDEDFGDGSLHSILIQIFASVPEAHIMNAGSKSPEIVGPFMKEYYSARNIGPDTEERSLHHFQRAVELSGGNSPSPFISAAKGLAVPAQDYPRFEELLKAALAIDPESVPEKKLEILIYQEKARWLLENRENFFILDFEE